MANLTENIGHIANLLHSKNKEDLLYKSTSLDSEALDYSIESLRILNKYLDKVRRSKIPGGDIDRICLRLGAYLGEVVRIAADNPKLKWIRYETGAKKDKSIKSLGKDISTCLMLNYQDQYYFPIGRIYKYLKTGKENNLEAYARVVLDMLNAE